jgi:predicted nucleotidyltransferase
MVERAALDPIPKMGMFIPVMGRARRQPSLAGALLTPVQMRVLGLLFGQPERRFQSAELIRLARSGTGAVHRQLGRLAAVGLVSVTAVGNQKFYQANAASPVFQELHGLIVKTVGLVEPLRHAIAPLGDRIAAAFVYGSMAKGSDRADSDVDLLVLSDSVRHEELYSALAPAERELGRPINPTLLTRAAWRSKRAAKDSFASRITKGPHLMVLGSHDDLD